MSSFTRFRNKTNPCPVCGGTRKDDDCRQSLTTGEVHCRGASDYSPPEGWTFRNQDSLGFNCFRRDDGRFFMDAAERRAIFGDTPQTRAESAAAAARRRKEEYLADKIVVDEFTRYEKTKFPLTGSLLWQFVHALKLPSVCFSRAGLFGIVNKFNRPALLYDEYDGEGNIIARRTRSEDGGKYAVKSAGLVYDTKTEIEDTPVLCVEGMSDTMVGDYLEIETIGRPSNSGGAEHLAQLMLYSNVPASRLIVILGENDRKADGTWPGRDGAYKVAAKVANLLRRTVHVAMPPAGSKDLRDWYHQQWIDFINPSTLATSSDDWYAMPEEQRTILGARLTDHITSGMIAFEPDGVVQRAATNAVASTAVGAVMTAAAVVKTAAEIALDQATTLCDEIAAAGLPEKKYNHHDCNQGHDSDHKHDRGLIYRRCPNACRKFMLNDKHRRGGLFRFSCGQITCEVCGPRCRQRWQETIRHRLRQHMAGEIDPTTAGEPVFVFDCLAAVWPSLSRAVRRGGGDFIRLDLVSNGHYVIVTSVRPTDRVLRTAGINRDAVRTESPTDAATALVGLLETSPLIGKVWAASHRWKLLSDEPMEPQGWKGIGKYTGTDGEETEVLAHFKCRDRQMPSRGKWSPYHARVFNLPAGFDSNHFYDCLCVGEIVQQTPRDDDGNIVVGPRAEANVEPVAGNQYKFTLNLGL